MPPNTVALAYAATLLDMLEYARALVRERLVARLPDFAERAAALHTDAALPPGRRVNTIIDGISESFYRRFTHGRLEKIASRYMDRAQARQKDDFAEQVKQSIGIDLPGTLDRKLKARVEAATANNVALIKSIPQTYFDQVEKVTVAALAAGERHEKIGELIGERFDVAEESARLVARDQTLKFYGEMNKVRQEGLGVERYIWRTVDDERVRSVHSDFDGNTYSWDDPPGDGSPQQGTHPATAINCRCWAEPVLEGLLDGDTEQI